jgi:hypothetical protein
MREGKMLHFATLATPGQQTRVNTLENPMVNNEKSRFFIM